jgi:HEAT repeat protein
MIVNPLMEILGSSPREMQRFWAARIFGALRLQKPVPKLLFALSDHSPRVRAEAITAIGSIGTHEGVAPLSKILLEDPVALVREAAAEALGKIADDRALETLKQALQDVDVATRRRAMEALERMGERAVPFFLSALSGQSDEAAVQSANALERLGWVSRWVENLAGDQWESHAEQLTRIAKFGVVETLARSLTHPVMQVRIRLCRILAVRPTPRTFEALTDLAQKDGEWAVRLEALTTLIRLADDRTSVLVGHALETEEEMVQEKLLQVLCKGSKRASEVAEETMEKVRKAMGLL